MKVEFCIPIGLHSIIKENQEYNEDVLYFALDPDVRKRKVEDFIYIINKMKTRKATGSDKPLLTF